MIRLLSLGMRSTSTTDDAVCSNPNCGETGALGQCFKKRKV